ncbi:hypothetical protein U1Q18_036565, partial [Sarracenia purpurea var. burkii]
DQDRVNPSVNGLFQQNQKSVLRSEKPGSSLTNRPMVVAKVVDDVWLKSSAVRITKVHILVDAIQEAMTAIGVNGIKVKSMAKNKTLI